MTSPDITPIPHIDTVTDPFHGAEQLRQRWRALMGPLGFSERRLWFMLVDADKRMLPAANQLELPHRPHPDLADLLMRRLRNVVTAESIADNPITVALLLTRPGFDGVTAHDYEWTRLLIDAATRRRVVIHPIHRANDATLVTVLAADKAA